VNRLSITRLLGSIYLNRKGPQDLSKIILILGQIIEKPSVQKVTECMGDPKRYPGLCCKLFLARILVRVLEKKPSEIPAVFTEVLSNIFRINSEIGRDQVIAELKQYEKDTMKQAASLGDKGLDLIFNYQSHRSHTQQRLMKNSPYLPSVFVAAMLYGVASVENFAHKNLTSVKFVSNGNFFRQYLLQYLQSDVEKLDIIELTKSLVSQLNRQTKNQFTHDFDHLFLKLGVNSKLDRQKVFCQRINSGGGVVFHSADSANALICYIMAHKNYVSTIPKFIKFLGEKNIEYSAESWRKLLICCRYLDMDQLLALISNRVDARHSMGDVLVNASDQALERFLCSHREKLGSQLAQMILSDAATQRQLFGSASPSYQPSMLLQQTIPAKLMAADLKRWLNKQPYSDRKNKFNDMFKELCRIYSGISNNTISEEDIVQCLFPYLDPSLFVSRKGKGGGRRYTTDNSILPVMLFLVNVFYKNCKPARPIPHGQGSFEDIYS